MELVKYTEVIKAATEQLCQNGGAFLTAGSGENINTMTIGWGAIGYYWGKPVFTIVVRPQRHTYGLIDGEFTVSVPLHDMKKELSFAGTTSGKDINKFVGHGLTPAPSIEVAPPIVAECELHFECKVRLMQDMTSDRMDTAVSRTMYPAGDYHTMFFGEIVKCYRTDRL